jgi:cytochrome c nitrite reductase small subunit
MSMAMSRLLRWAGVALGVVILLFVAAFIALKIPPISDAANDPALCGRCHVMDPTIQSFSISAHRDLNCNDCHTAHGFLTGPISKMGLGAKHVIFFTAGLQPQHLRASEITRGLAKENCLRCHDTLMRQIENLSDRPCSDCHRFTPHGVLP